MIPVILFGFLFGIFFGSFGIVGWAYALTFLSLALIFYFYKLFVREEHRKVLFLIFIFLLSFTVGLLRVQYSDINKRSSLEAFENKQNSFVGIIVSEPDVRESNTKYTVLVEEIVYSTTTIPVSEKIIISTSLYPEFSYGDKISFSTKLKKPQNIENDDGRVFDYSGYLRARGVWYTANFVYPKLISKDNGNFLKKYLFSIKRSFTDSINRTFSEPESSLLSGLLLGTKQSLGKDWLDKFSKTGVSHIVVLSGYNIAIVASSIMAFLRFLPKNIAFSFGCLGIILFTILSGAGASAVRAAIMVLVALFAQKFNRDYKAGRALGFAVVLMLAPNPLLLVFDPSFQLSVLATIGLVFVSPILSPYFLWVTEKFGFREIVSSTISTQLTVLPLLIFNTGIISIVSLPVNVLILGTIPTTMFFGFVTGLLGFLSLYISFVPGIFAYALLWYQLKIVDIASSIPLGFLKIPAFSFLILIFVYLVIIFSLYFLKNKNPVPERTTVSEQSSIRDTGSVRG